MNNWFNHLYPYGNLHELNLDWILNTINKLVETMDNFINLNTIKYADPILWDITSQYEANTVVVDGRTGNAYISTRAVPSGVQLTRSEYWIQIYNYADELDKLREQIANNEGESTTATHPYSVGDLVFIGGELYRVIASMIAGDSFVVDSNVVKTTIENEIKLVLIRTLDTIDDIVGSLDDLDTEDKSNIVSAINEVLSTIGDITNLDTEDKSNIVSAINEVLSTIDSDLSNIVGDLENLTTSDKTNVVNAINSLNAYVGRVSNYIYYPENYGAVGDGVTDDSTAIQNMFNAMVPGATAHFTSPSGYLIGTTLELRVQDVILTGGYGFIERKRSLITQLPITILKVYSVGVNISNLNFFQPGDNYRNGVGVEFLGGSQGDTDSWISDCVFGYFDKGVIFRGKNIEIHNSMLSHCNMCIDIEPTEIDTENRGYVISNNRMHSSNQAIYHNIDKPTRYRNNVIVRNNFSDFCDRFYYGYNGCIIENNSIYDVGQQASLNGLAICIRASESEKPTSIKSNYISTPIENTTFRGIEVDTSNGIVDVQSNVIEGFGTYGIWLNNSGIMIVKDNLIQSCNFGIVVGANVSKGVVSNNIGYNIETSMINPTPSQTVTIENNVEL